MSSILECSLKFMGATMASIAVVGAGNCMTKRVSTVTLPDGTTRTVRIIYKSPELIRKENIADFNAEMRKFAVRDLAAERISKVIPSPVKEKLNK